MTEAPHVSTFIPSWLAFHITAKIGLLLFSVYIRMSLQINVGNEVIWLNVF
jgi:hypothetical protein